MIAIKKRGTLKTSPCGTPFSTVRGEEVTFWILTMRDLLLRSFVVEKEDYHTIRFHRISEVDEPLSRDRVTDIFTRSPH